MEQFIVGNWFANRAKLKIQTYLIENVEFELMALTQSLIESVKSCESYEDMISLAANSGISYNRKRVIDNEELAKDIELLWGLDKLEIDSDPCIKYRVGEKVCSISGLTDFIEEKLLNEQLEEEERAEAKEKAKALVKTGVIDGDQELDPDVTLGELNDDAHYTANNHT